MTRRKLTNRSDRARRHYQSGYGSRHRSNWGTGFHLAPYAEGDVIDIPEGAPAFERMRYPACVPGLYRVTAGFSIGEGPEWYFRVVPIIDGETQWLLGSDRMHLIPGVCDYTAGWEVIESAAPLPTQDEAVRAEGYTEMPDTDGGADFALVTLDRWGKPNCTRHGSMNKVSPVFWRCIATAGPKSNGCRAGCMETATE